MSLPRFCIALLGVALPALACADLLPLQVRKGANPAIIDARDRTVLLRGVNYNALGDYFEANPDQPAVVPYQADDFARMAQLGMNVVRLLISWSALEPQRGVIDDAYLDQIRTAVADAKANGLYVVLDMHQDAWGKFIATPDSTDCGFFQPSIGWDGAPAWATLTDGQSTCRFPGLRELSPAVARAFENFWRNRDGIQDALIATWARLAREFAAEPAVAGYDFLNEPNFGVSVGLSQILLMGNFYSKTLRAIRTAEQSVPGGFAHIGFFEPSVEWSAFGITLPPLGLFMLDRNIVFAPHLYSGSITVTGTVASGYANAAKVAGIYRAPFWSGEWGWFGAPADSEASIWEYAQYEDRYRIGGAVWQWRQACGDPHAQGSREGRTVTEPQYHVIINLCPGDEDGGVSPAYERILARAYPRHAPGELLQLHSDPYSGVLTLVGESDEEGDLELWVPTSARVNVPQLDGSDAVQVESRSGGFLIRATVSGHYHITLQY